MNLGGPVWHASVAPGSSGLIVGVRRALEAEARHQLAGLGDPSLGEWTEWTGQAFHLRRRLNDREQASVGPVVDVRRTVEARRRALRLGGLLRYAPDEVLLDELGGDL